jgi:hypothetical protein
MRRVVELRQYTLKPGQRDVLIDLFEREFVESQEEQGIDIIGTFRDAGDTDRFVWLRGFADMDARAKSLAAFYSGPVWQQHRDAANRTMIDSDNVLLLKAAWEGADFPSAGLRAPIGAVAPASGCMLAVIYYFDESVSERVISAFRRAMPARYEAAGAAISACFVTEPGPNSFPALPVREGENVLAWFAMFANAHAAHALPSGFEQYLSKPVETLRLLPTARSRLHLSGQVSEIAGDDL